MYDILIMGELLVEIMRDQADGELYQAGIFKGPYASGAPAICASSASRLGSRVAVIGGVGDDEFGKCIIDRLKECGTDISLIGISREVATGVAFNETLTDGGRKFIYHMGNSAAVCAKVPDGLKMDGLKFMHIMGCSLACNKDYAARILKMMHAVHDKGAKISFDPNVRKELFTEESFSGILNDVLEHTSVFLPGVEELKMIMDKDSVEDAVEKCFAYPKMEIVLLKNGSRGCTLYQRGKKPKAFPACKITQKDATGAGDCFDGAFLAGICQGKDVDTACRWASAAGALNAAAFGPMEGDISIDTVEKMIEG